VSKEINMSHVKHETRQATNRILEMIKEGLLDRDTVITAAFRYMSEDDVADMAHCNGFFEYEDEEEEDEEDEEEDEEVDEE
jgi:hypothetical protein